jgi:hypothetical protein
MGERCVAMTKAGGRCRRGVMRAGSGRFCVVHERGIARAAGAGRCVAVTVRGERCRGWARRGERGLCLVHEGAGARCEGVTARGKRCRRVAVAGSRGRYGRWLCVRHEPGYVFPVPPEGRRCEARTLAGGRCKRWARAGTDGGPVLCVAHDVGQGHPNLRHGYYRRLPYFGPVEAAYVGAAARAGKPLAAELFVMRLKVQGLLAYAAGEGLTRRQRVGVDELLLRATRLIGALLAARQGMGLVAMGEGTGGGVRALLAQCGEAEAGGG